MLGLGVGGGRGGGGGGASATHFITDHKQTQLNRVCYFHIFGVFLAFKGSNYSELILLGHQILFKCEY